MDGLLVIDKPRGPTSHDVVARMRRLLGERRIGHTGTLDPLATGVLPLVLGRATRLARFLSASDKTYEAVVRLGVRTDTYDAEGTPVGAPFSGTLPARKDVERALDEFRGTYEQRPPAYSAKKIAGKRSYSLARAEAQKGRDARLNPCATAGASVEPRAMSAGWTPRASEVTAAVELIAVDAALVSLRIECSAGFYVRSLAADLGDRLGTGAHLVALRRTRSGDYSLGDAVLFSDAERDAELAVRAVIPLDRMLPSWPALELTAEGVQYAAHGRALSPASATGRLPWQTGSQVRLIDQAGRLIGLAEGTGGGLLHPFVIFM